MRLIDADALIEAFDPDHRCDWYTPDIIETIEEQPTVEPVRGEWIQDEYPFQHIVRCSNCNRMSIFGKTKFCHNCGADMREKVEE